MSPKPPAPPLPPKVRYSLDPDPEDTVTWRYNAEKRLGALEAGQATINGRIAVLDEKIEAGNKTIDETKVIAVQTQANTADLVKVAGNWKGAIAVAGTLGHFAKWAMILGGFVLAMKSGLHDFIFGAAK